jgi:hypothetical protein
LFGSCPRHSASFGNWRTFRRTRCNLNGGSGVCRFCAALCCRMRRPAESHFASQWMRISHRTLTGSPAPRPHQSKGSTRRHPRHPQSGGRGKSGSAALPPSASVPTTWRLR